MRMIPLLALFLAASNPAQANWFTSIFKGDSKPDGISGCRAPIEAPPPRLEEEGTAEEAPPPAANFQQTCNDAQILSFLHVRSNQDSYLRTQARQGTLSRADLLLIRVAPVVKNRYHKIVQPAKSLGRLVQRPICERTSFTGTSTDPTHMPELLGCRFTFESELPGDLATPFPGRVTLSVNLSIHLEIDEESRALPSRNRIRRIDNSFGPPARFQVMLTSDPIVQSVTPVNFAPRSQPVSEPAAAEAAKPDRNGLPLNVDAVRLALARRAIQAHEDTRVTVVEEEKRTRRSDGTVVDSDGFDDCGETEALSPRLSFMGSAELEERCYTYRTMPILPGSGDSGFNGQVRILFQKSLTNPQRIVGIRAFSFGGNL